MGLLKWAIGGAAAFLGYEGYKKYKLKKGPAAGFAFVPGHMNAFTFGYSGAGTGGQLTNAQAQAIFNANHPGLFDVVSVNVTPANKLISVGAVFTGPAAASYTAPTLTAGWPTAYGTVTANQVQDMGGAPQTGATALATATG